MESKPKEVVKKPEDDLVKFKKGKLIVQYPREFATKESEHLKANGFLEYKVPKKKKPANPEADKETTASN